MNIYTPNEIVALPLTTREEERHSREREGQHVFISRYFHEYNQLNLNEKIALFETDENSVDSLDTVKVPPVWDVMARASTVWASLDVEVKQGWENRTIMLNDRPVPGFTRFHLLYLQCLHQNIISVRDCCMTFATSRES